ncbi:DUF2339 domain-containing protein [soil metagenome]
MTDKNEQIKQLLARLDKMVEYQSYFFREIKLIREEIKKLETIQPKPPVFTPPEIPKKPIPREDISFYKPPQPKPTVEQKPSEKKADYQPIYQKSKPAYQSNYQTREKSDFGSSANSQSSSAEEKQPILQKLGVEEFVGRNLISLIGIVITIIGVAIGAKYAIDSNLISPAMRIILGYAFAFATLGIAVRLKAKYDSFSAILLSGAMAMLYFLTFFAYSFYDLMPQTAAFLMMLLITAFTVAAAINYNRQVIAHIGLVGAYAVPFLLSNDSGRAAILFGYMTIVNFGILVVSVKKFWKPLFYSSFIFSWLIFAAWYFTRYNSAEHFTLAFAFLTIFFATFYLTFVSYKLVADEEFNSEIVLLILVNSIIFYALGYSILDSRADGREFLGLFTIANAFIHFFLAAIVKKYRLGGNINLYLPFTLSLTFLTLAFPVQFRGHWLTVFWVAEAAFLFVVGRTKRLAIFETFSYPLLALALISLFNGLQTAFVSEAVLTPFLNTNFLTSAIFAADFGAIYFINARKNDSEIVPKDLQEIVNIIFPTIFLVILYNTFRTEIGNYFHGELVRTAVSIPPPFAAASPSFLKDSSLEYFNWIWHINYTMFFLTVLSFVNIKRIKSQFLASINIGLNVIFIFVFITAGLYFISELRENYLAQTNAEYFSRGIFHLLVRYISYAFIAGLIAAVYEYFKQKFVRDYLPDLPLDLIFDAVFYFTMLWIFSSELLNLMDVFGVADSYKLGLSILWGIFALALIVIGIYKRKTYLRISAIVLFALTLVKLFFYDIADLSTISKTVVFISLGVLLLIISFLYNKFKDVISENNEMKL